MIPIEDQRDLALETVIGDIKGTIVNAQMYPPGSHITANMGAIAYKSLTEYLKTRKQFVINDAEDKLWLEKKKIVRVKGFREMMARHKIRNIQFLKGVTEKEIIQFCEAMAMKKESLAKFKRFMDYLATKGVSHIATDETIYIDLSDGQEVVYRTPTGVVKTTEGGNSSSGLVSVGSFHESVLRLGQTQDPQVQSELRQRILADLLHSSPDTLRDLYVQQQEEVGPAADLLNEVTQTMTKQALEEVIGNICSLQQKIKVEVRSAEDFHQRIEPLRKAITRILQSPASREISPKLYAYLRSLGLLNHLPHGMQLSSESFSFIAVAESLMELPSSFLLTHPLRNNLLDLLKTMCMRDQAEAIQKMVTKLLENLHHENADIRYQGITLLQDVQTILQANQKDALTDQIVKALLELVEDEFSSNVYGALGACLADAAHNNMIHWRFEEAVTILKVFRRHRIDEFLPMTQRRALAGSVLRSFSENVIEVVYSDLNSIVPQRQNGATLILTQLGDEATIPLIEALKRSDDPRVRQAILKALQFLGGELKNTLLKFIDVKTPMETLSRLLPILDPIADSTMLAPLLPLLKHPEGLIRRETLRILTQLPMDPHILDALHFSLKDPDLSVQRIAIQRLGELHEKKTVPLLIEKLKIVPALQEDICLALGMIRDPSAIGALMHCLLDTQSLFNRKFKYSDPVRIRAAWALQQMLPNPDARKSLAKARRDPNPIVQQSVKESLLRAA